MYNFISGKAIMTTINRLVGNKLPTEYHDDVLEWIPEASRLMETKFSLIRASTPSRGCGGELISNNHIISIPCGTQAILALEDEHGRRIPEGGDVTNLANASTRYHEGTPNQVLDTATRSTNFQMDVAETNGVNPYGIIPGAETAVPWDGSDIVPLTDTSRDTYYIVDGPYLQTSLATMFVKIHYLTIPMDDCGYPLIPDNENYLQASAWFAIRNLIGAGYRHPRFEKTFRDGGWSHTDELFEKYAGRALGELKMWSMDGANKVQTGLSERLVPPTHFAGDFFIGMGADRQTIHT